jgi:hypothetical protein
MSFSGASVEIAVVAIGDLPFGAKIPRLALPLTIVALRISVDKRKSYLPFPPAGTLLVREV